MRFLNFAQIDIIGAKLLALRCSLNDVQKKNVLTFRHKAGYFCLHCCHT